MWYKDEEASSFVRKRLYKQREKLHWSSLYNQIPCCFLTRRHASKCTDLECRIAHCYLIKNGSFRMISWEIIIFCSASKQSPVLSHCKQCFCWVPEPRAASSPPREMLLTNPQGFLIKCDWIEPSVPRRQANLYLAYFLFLHLFLSSPEQGVCGKRRPVNCLHLPICTSFPQWACVWNMKGSEQNGKFPLH